MLAIKIKVLTAIDIKNQIIQARDATIDSPLKALLRRALSGGHENKTHAI